MPLTELQADLEALRRHATLSARYAAIGRQELIDFSKDREQLRAELAAERTAHEQTRRQLDAEQKERRADWAAVEWYVFVSRIKRDIEIRARVCHEAERILKMLEQEQKP